MSLLQEVIEQLEAEEDFLCTLQASSNFFTTNSSCHSSEENEHSYECSLHTVSLQRKMSIYPKALITR